MAETILTMFRTVLPPESEQEEGVSFGDTDGPSVFLPWKLYEELGSPQALTIAILPGDDQEWLARSAEDVLGRDG